MKFKKQFANVIIVAGVVLLIAAAALFGYNTLQSRKASADARRVLTALEEKMTAQKMTATQDDVKVELPSGVFPKNESEMESLSIDGDAYIGYLSLPSLDLRLPIMSDWSYKKLKTAPCRYYGTVSGGDLVLMAHNFAGHFGKISKLNLGDKVFFTDINGHTTEYDVVGQDILQPYATKEMVAGDFDLTLFTCTYGGQNRVTIYCNRPS